MATNGHFCWPSVGSYVAAYGQFFMAANNRAHRASFNEPQQSLRQDDFG